MSRSLHFSRSGALLFKRQGSECTVDVPSDPGTRHGALTTVGIYLQIFLQYACIFKVSVVSEAALHVAVVILTRKCNSEHRNESLCIT